MTLRTVLVDDAPDVRALLRSALTRDGRFTVVGEAADGREAIDVVADAQPDVVVLDINMPLLDGLSTLPSLRTLSPGTRIVMLSGYSAEEMARPSLERGAVGYIEKSTEIARLPSQIHALATVLDTMQHVLDETYTSTPQSASDARHDLRAAFAASTDPTVVDVVELLASELVTNAVRHARSAARVTAAIVAGGRVRVRVTDDGPGLPVLQPAGEDAENGRGLELVELLAESWGVDEIDSGKAVWFEVKL